MKKRPRRSVSLGTVVMLCVTFVVLVGTGVILPRMMGTADIRIDIQSLSALDLGAALPALSLSDIPLGATGTEPVEASDSALETSATPPPTATPAPTPTPRPGGSVAITLGGSIYWEDAVRKSTYYSDSDKYDATEVLSLLAADLQSDITLVSLENLVVPGAKVSDLIAPDAVMDMLLAGEVDMVALGFPKALDRGMEGLQSTLDAAHRRSLDTLGAYLSQEDADTIRMVTVDHVQVAFLHYTETPSATGKKNIKSADAAYALPDAATHGAKDIARARELGADVVVVSLNWATSGSSKPTAKQKELAQQLADAGADVLVGTGSRVVQPVAWLTSKRADGTIRQTLCAWSLGCIISDSRKDGNVAGMLLQLQLSWDGSALSFERVSYVPTYIWRYKQDGQYRYRVVASDQSAPDGMSSDQAEYMLKALKRVKKALEGSPVTLRVK